MDKTELIKLMKEYDFVTNTKESFAKKYNISARTVSNYIKEFGIKCKKSGVAVDKNRDNFGKFTYNSSLQNDCKVNIEVDETRDLSDPVNKPIRSLKAYCEKYDRYFSSNK